MYSSNALDPTFAFAWALPLKVDSCGYLTLNQPTLALCEESR